MQHGTARAVVVVGSLHYDIMLSAPHLPARGETVTGTHWSPKFGGKGGNQAIAASRAGAETRLVGALGDDAFASFMRAHLDRAGLAMRHVETRADHPTGMSVAISETGGDYGAVIVSGVNLAIDPRSLRDPELWRDAGLLLLQNEVRETLNVEAARNARAHGLRVCLNAAPARPLSPELACLIDILVVNALEAGVLGTPPVSDLTTAGDAAIRLAAAYPVAIVTAGDAGCAACTTAGNPILVPARPVTLVSTHGAGDTFTGALCAALAKGEDLVPALHAATAAAAAHVSGTA